MKTTLNKIKEHDPCQEGWEKLLKGLNKTKSDDEPLELSFILENNGYSDALWALRAVEGYDREIRLFAVWCARQVEHLMNDSRSIEALNVAEKFANGEATSDAAWAAAWAAARAAAWDAAWDAASDAARAAARAAASDAAWDAASDAAWAAARAAARAAASDAAWDAARAAARDAQIVEFKTLICKTTG